jgi:hypothetical protein
MNKGLKDGGYIQLNPLFLFIIIKPILNLLPQNLNSANLIYLSERMNKLILAVLIAAYLLLIFPAQATIYVGGENGVPTISEVIEKASENETIIVCEGIYRENVVIDKTLILKASGNVTFRIRCRESKFIKTR